MKTIKKVVMSVLLALLVLPVYAHNHSSNNGGVYFSPGVGYSQPAYGYGNSCGLVWVPQQQTEYGNWIPGHYVNTCSYYSGYGGGVYYGNNGGHHGDGHHHYH